MMTTVAAGGLQAEAPDVAASILRGQQAIKLDKRNDPLEGADNKVQFNESLQKELPLSIFSEAARTNPTGPYAMMRGAVAGRVADMLALSPDKKVTEAMVKTAVQDVTGGVLDAHGSKIIAPARGMQQGQFEATLAGLTDADFGNAAPASHLAEAQRVLNLTPQETALYQRHLSNLYGSGGVTNANGSRSTLFQLSFEQDGKTYNVPTVYDGKILKPEDAIARAKSQGLDKFPSYGSEAEAEARYQQMHDYMEKDTGQYFRGSPDAVTTLSGAPVTAQYIRDQGQLESYGDGRYLIKIGNGYAVQGANQEHSDFVRPFVLDLRNRVPLPGYRPPVRRTIGDLILRAGG
jgi:hypothetical protein